jgi:hypothetical protein
MRTKRWAVIAVSLLAAGLLYVHLHAAPVPEPVARPQVGRYTTARVTQVSTREDGRKSYRELQVLLDSATGKLWVLEEQGKDKKPRDKWALAADAPK